MKAWTVWVGLSLALVVLSGCSSKDKGDEGSNGEPDPSTFGDTTYDRAYAQEGHRVTGSLAGTAESVGSEGGASLDIREFGNSDAGGAVDKATFVLEVHQAGFEVRATLRDMATAAEAGDAGANYMGGTAQNMQIFGTTGVGPSELPTTTAYLFAAGFAQLSIGGTPQPTQRLVLAAVTQGLRGADQGPLATPDATDLQFHVVFPGDLLGTNETITGVQDGFLYYYFTSVAVEHLSDADKENVGAGLRPPEAQNAKPDAVGKILVDGNVASSGQRESENNLTVTFDATGSTDTDGTISVYLWRVAEMNTTGAFVAAPVATALGQTVDYNFTSPGAKLIELVVRDNGHATDNLTIGFYVNQHRVIASQDTNLQANTVSGMTDCKEAVNCFHFPTSVQAGIVSATYSFLDNDSALINDVHLELYAPDAELPDPPASDGDDPVAEQAGAEDTPLVVPGTAFLPELYGKQYKIAIWWGAGVDVSYSIDVVHVYAPQVPG